MKLKSWIRNLFKPEFYLRLQLHFVTGSSRQNVPARLKFAQSYMPFPSARRAAIYLCWALFLAIPAVAFTQTSYYSASSPTNYPIIGSLPGDQTYPDVAINAQGGYVVWQDNITDPVGEGISAMQLNSTLSGSGDVFQVNVTATNDQKNARVSLLKNGGAAFVWQGGPDSKQHIYARFLNQSNIWLNKTNVLVSGTNSFQIQPVIATLTNGNVIVVWTSFDQANSSSLDDIYGQMLSTNGTKIGASFLINQFTTYNQRTPTVAALDNGGFVVAWISEQERSSAPNWGDNEIAYGTNSLLGLSMSSVDVYERLYTVSGNNTTPSAASNEILVNQDNNPCSGPDIAVASDGSYMVTWCANSLTNETSSWDVYERSFTNENGGPVYMVNSYTYGDQYNPQISAISNQFLIVFTSLGQDGSREGVYGQFVNEGDSPAGSEFLVNTTTAGQQMQQAVASDGVAQFLTVWTSYTFTPNGFDLYAQKYVNAAIDLEPMAAPFVTAPLELNDDRVYQPQLVVSWPPVQGLSVSGYQVFVDGGARNIATVTSNEWAMTAAQGLRASSTHSFAVRYVTSSGSVSPISPSTSGTTWSGLTWEGVPYEWMREYYGSNTNSWPSARAPVVADGPTLRQIFISGGNPVNADTWLRTTLTRSSRGMFLNWNTQPGLTYQVQETTNFINWVNLGSQRFESGTNDSIYLGSGGASYYRIQLLR